MHVDCMLMCNNMLMCVLCKPRKNNTDMFANIKSEKYSFPSPFWDNVSEEAKVSHSASLTVEYTIILIPRPQKLELPV